MNQNRFISLLKVHLIVDFAMFQALTPSTLYVMKPLGFHCNIHQFCHIFGTLLTFLEHHIDSQCLEFLRGRKFDAVGTEHTAQIFKTEDVAIN